MIRKPAVAGSFYSSNPTQLKNEIENFLSNVEKKDIKNPKAIISPHAGYFYSGQVAANGYKHVEGKDYNIVVVFAPCHRGMFDGVSIFNGKGYETPLGVVPINTDISEKLINSSNLINFIPQAHTQEHSLEVQVPFLQVVLKNFKLIPVLVGTQDFDQLHEVAKVFYEKLKNENVLYIASTDLSHFYSSETANKLDSVAVTHIKNLDIKGFCNAVINGKTEACGAGPVSIILSLAKLYNWNRCEILKYADSGDVSGDKTSVVGYLSAIIYKNSNSSQGLTDYEKDILKKIAKESIRAELFGEKFNLDYERTENLKQKRGAFVTLHKNGNLRGCIGYIQGVDSLDTTVKKMAVSAAFEDPRFPSLNKDEFNDIDIEISALTPLKKIRDINEIEVGKHGILLVKGFNSGLLLPQVATEYGWDSLTFLDQTCVKAGLYPGCWKENDTEIYIFSAEVF
jgi:AmmeMemoRadiSam system protein B/AmmeMemoRadiSam system protein A